MTIVSNLVKLIRDELHDAEKYADLALKHKDSDAELSAMFKNLATAELNHADQEHTQAVRMIRKYTDSGKRAPDAMQAVWDWEHEQMIDRKKEIKIVLDMV